MKLMQQSNRDNMATKKAGKKKEYYLNLRDQYKPSRIDVVFISESPPASGKYFYDVTGRVTEPLFSAMMWVIGFNPKCKEVGLTRFANSGHFLVDAVYTPVNRLTEKERKEIILENLGNLIEDISKLDKDKRFKIVLIKANICRLLEDYLKSAGYNVLNRGIVIPFPASGQQANFRNMISKVYMYDQVG